MRNLLFALLVLVGGCYTEKDLKDKNASSITVWLATKDLRPILVDCVQTKGNTSFQFCEVQLENKDILSFACQWMSDKCVVIGHIPSSKLEKNE